MESFYDTREGLVSSADYGSPDYRLPPPLLVTLQEGEPIRLSTREVNLLKRVLSAVQEVPGGPGEIMTRMRPIMTSACDYETALGLLSYLPYMEEPAPVVPLNGPVAQEYVVSNGSVAEHIPAPDVRDYPDPITFSLAYRIWKQSHATG